MRYGWRGIWLFSPDASVGGGASPSSDALTVGNSGESGGEPQASSSPPDGAETGGDDYADLAGDERVQAYLKAQTEKRFSHIPADHRSPEAYRRLIQAAQQAQAIQSDPQWRAFMAARQAAQGQEPQEQPFHADILTALEKDTGTPMSTQQRRFIGGMLDATAKAMEQRFIQQHVAPLKTYLVNQYLDRERTEAAKLPQYKQYERDIVGIVQKYGIPYEEAYKIAVHGKQILPPSPGEAAPAADDAERGRASDRRSSEGERPSGASAAGNRMPKYKNAQDSRNGAAAFLRSRGIRVE